MKSLTEYLIDALSNTKLFEMTISKKDYQDKLFNASTQIVQNWCLCKYCTLYDNNNENHKHWQTELWAQVSIFSKTNLKYSSKQSYTNHVLIKQLEFDKKNEIVKWVDDKWIDEKLDKNILPIIAKELTIEIGYLVSLISNNDYMKLKNYCYNL